MEMKSPPPCPSTVTVRRNPPRRARATPSSAIPLREALSSPSLSRNIFSTEILQNPNNTDDINTNSSTRIVSQNLKVFLRIRPLTVQKVSKNVAESKNAWPKNPKIKVNSRPKIKKSSEICVQVNEDMRSVTVSTPQQLQEMKRVKSEVYEGFSHVFASEVSQTDVYEEMVKPLVEDFLKGKSGMLAAMGPSGSGKTHTVFGCAREPGMVPLVLRGIFSENESATHISRVYLSMFEISSEKGKAERMTDLLHDGGDISIQQSVINGLQEVVVSDAQQAESLITHGMLKRATAMTNSNSRSSRSQCIINIRHDSTKGGEVDGNASGSMLTIVDLAGAEREKKTGNQGARLLESNFINNTSMVFGQCLRSLLEHQRNRNKPLQKHYKNSLLTRYLQDYLEGKKRMALILTVKPGVEDYLDTSFLLRQASPFTKIKFKTVEEPVNLTCSKRPNQALPQAGQLKKMKFSNSEASLIDEGNIDRGLGLNMRKGCSEIAGKVIKGCLNQNIEENEIHVLSDGFVGLGIREKSSLNGEYGKPNVNKDREYQIMQGLSKALWTVLKQYKEKLEGVEMENCHLRDSLANGKTRSLDLENELTREKMRLVDLENELKELISRCTCCRKASANVFPVSMHDANFHLSQYRMADLLEANSEISSRELEKTEIEKKPDPKARDSILTSCSAGPEEHYTQPLEDLLQSSDDIEDPKGLKDTSELDMCSRSSQVLSTSYNSSQDLIFHEDMCIVDMPSSSQSTTSGSLDPSQKSEQDAVNIVGDVKNLEPESECVSNGSCFVTSLEYESAQDSEDTENTKGLKDTSEVDMFSSGSQVLSTSTNCSQDLIFHEDMCIVDMPSSSQATSRSTSGSLYTSHKSELDVVNIAGDVKNLEPESECVSKGSCFATSLECESAKSTQDSEDLTDAKQEPTSLSTSGSLYTSHKSEQDAVNIAGDVKNLEPESECVSKGSCFSASLECESAKSTQDSEDLKDAKQEPTSLSTSGSLYISHKSEQDAANIVGDVKNSEPESEYVLKGSCFSASLECESAKSTQDSEDLKDAKQEPTQFENGATDNSHTVVNSSESPSKDDMCYQVDEEQCSNKEGKVEPLVTGLPQKGSDAKNACKFVPKIVAPCSNFQLTEKPKRRLQPASSVLLKDISLLNMKDENDKPKGARVGKRTAMDEKNRTQGSLSLLNLLTK